MDAPAKTSDPVFPGLELADLEDAVLNGALESAPFDTANAETVDDAVETQDETNDEAEAAPAEEALPEVEPEAVLDAGEADTSGVLEELDLEAELERELQSTVSEGAEIEVPEPATDVSAPRTAPDLETVELELTMQHDDLIKLTFEDSLKAALDRLGGKLLFDMRLDNVDDCQRVAAVRLGDGTDKQFALVIMPPPGGGSVRIEPAAESNNPLAAIAESYDGLMTALKMAA